MTEQDFLKQIWRPYDQITIADGIRGKVLGVNFAAKSVRAYISGSPEWVKCELIETHTNAKGGECDDASIIEELHKRLLVAQEKINKMENERSRNYAKDLLFAVQNLKDGLSERKAKLEMVDDALAMIADRLDKMGIE